jgi:hypothetical protein
MIAAVTWMVCKAEPAIFRRKDSRNEKHMATASHNGEHHRFQYSCE